MNTFKTLSALLLIGLTQLHTSYADSDGMDVLETEDEAVIVDSLPLDGETYLTAKPDDHLRAKVVAIVNKSEQFGNGQTIRVYVNGKIAYKWLVSTGREQLETAVSGRIYRTTTPVGYFRPFKLEVNHHSETWNSDMPYSVFFKGGIATHEGHAIEKLGNRASGGCVRLSAETAKIFFNLVQKTGITKVPLINRNGTTQMVPAVASTDPTVPAQPAKPVMIDAYDVLIIVENPAPVSVKP